MTPEQIARVRESWAMIVPVISTVAGSLYERLFARDPSLRALFHNADPTTQRRKLMQTLAVVVASLDDINALLLAIRALGYRHAAYGTLAGTLGKAFDKETRDAWEGA